MGEVKSRTELITKFSLNSNQDVHLAVIGCQILEDFNAYSKEDIFCVATIVSELATNIIKYAGSGEIKIKSLVDDSSGDGIVIEAMDSGPGIQDKKAALVDGFSTGGTLGLGLPAIRRMSDSLKISSRPQGGTKVEVMRLCRFSPNEQLSRSHQQAKMDRESSSKVNVNHSVPMNIEVEAMNRPCVGHSLSGDRSLALQGDSYWLLVQLDCTGHGRLAHESAKEIVDTLLSHINGWIDPQPDKCLVELLSVCNQRAKSGVGAAMSLALLQRETLNIHHVGIGNTSMMIFKRNGWEGVSRPGVLGYRYTKPLITSTTLKPGDAVVGFSDGISSTSVRAMRKQINRPTSTKGIIQSLLTAANDHDDASCVVLTCKTK